MANSVFSWRSRRDGGRLQSETAFRRQIATDSHPPGEYRSDTVRNVEAWYKAYDVVPGDKLYLKPEDRVRDLVMPLNIAFVEWPEDLSTETPQWDELERLRHRRAPRHPGH